MAVPRLARGGDLAGGDLQRREQRRGAVPLVVVGAPLGQAGLHRQHRRGPVQRLDLGLLVDAQHDRVLRRRQVQPDDVGDLGDQLRVGGELERLDPPRRDAVVAPRLGDRAVADPQVPAQQPARPVRHPVLLRRRLQRRRHDRRGGRCVRGRPERGSSSSPEIPCAAYRFRQSITVGRDTPTFAAIAVFDSPSAASNTIRARCARPARPERLDRVIRDSASRSPSRNPNASRRTIRHAPSSQPSNRKSTNYTRH